MYARALNISDPKKELLRLCALLHDIGHGVFSHQYDETVYKKMYPATKFGHDKHKIKIIKEYLPEVLLETYNEDEIKKAMKSSGLDAYLGTNTNESIHSIIDEISKIFKNKEDIYYNIVHGPFGCNRMDFIKRDSYFSGTLHYGGFPLDRFILFSFIKEGKLCYSSKILDDILLLLINRFHMFKNVYFHKTCRALDLMLQQILEYSMKPLNLVERTENLREFEKLNDTSLLYEISYHNRENRELKEARNLVERIVRRDLYKTVIDEADVFTSSQIKKYTASKFLRLIANNRKTKLEQLYHENEEDKCPQLFIDTPYEIKMSPPQELQRSNIDIYDETEDVVKKYRDIEIERSFRSWNVESFNIYRVYTASHTEREKLTPYVKMIMEKKEPETEITLM